jgi:hypothetical protein
VQLNRAAEDLAVEGQRIASSSWKVKVGRGIGHAGDARCPPALQGGRYADRFTCRRQSRMAAAHAICGMSVRVGRGSD